MSNGFVAGKFINQGYYKAFIPTEINKKWEINDMNVLYLLSQADRQLGRPDMYSEYVTVHPFLDGNGRVGRLIITLYSVSKGSLKRPILYLSDFFERNKSLYYDNLMRVRTHNDINQWFKFFLTGIIETAKIGVKTFDKILQIQQSMDSLLKPLKSRSGDARLVMNELFVNPLINAAKVEKIVGKSSVSAYKLVSDMEKLGIIKEITGGQRGKIYVFEEYVNLFK